MRKRSWIEWVMLAAVLVVPGMVLSQGVEESRSLVINGQAGQAPVVRMQGKSYVELEALARLTHGSLSFNGSQVTLTLAGSGANTATFFDLKVTWPATANVANAAGMVETFVAVNRN